MIVDTVHLIDGAIENLTVEPVTNLPSQVTKKGQLVYLIEPVGEHRKGLYVSNGVFWEVVGDITEVIAGLGLTGGSDYNGSSLNIDETYVATVERLTAEVAALESADATILQALANSEQASKSYTDSKILELVDGAPASLDSFNELAQAMNNDSNLASSLTASIADKLSLAGGTMQGSLTLSANPTANLEAASKQYVDVEVDAVADTVAANTSTMSGHITDQNVHVTAAQSLLLDGITVTATDINNLDGVSSNIQQQLVSEESSRIAGDAASKAYTDAEINKLVGSAPGALDTIHEIAAALKDDATIVDSLTAEIGTKMPMTGGTFTGSTYFDTDWGVTGFENGNGDGASFGVHNTKLTGSYGLGLSDNLGTVNGVYDFRSGVWDVKGTYRVNGAEVYHPGNNPTASDVGLSPLYTLSNNRLRILSDHGYTDIGASNTSYSHFNTSASIGYHFDKQVHAEDSISVHNTGTRLTGTSGHIAGHEIYHEGHKPTLGELGALGATEKAVDSDKLDGIDSTGFLKVGDRSTSVASTSNTTVATSSAVKSAYDLASGKLDANAKAVDSDKLDGLDSTAFLRTDVGGTVNSDVTVNGELVVTDLRVTGTTTQVDSNVVNIADSIITLNSDETSAPSQDGGIEIERGTETNVKWTWSEPNDVWTSNGAKIGNIGDPTLPTHVGDRGYNDARYLGITAKAVDSDKLDGKDSAAFVQVSSISTSTSSTSPDTVASSSAVKSAYDLASGKLDANAKAVDSDKLDGIDSTGFLKVGDRSTSVTSTSNTTVATSSAVKSAYDLASGKLDANAKAVDSNKLDGIDSTGFLKIGDRSTSVTSSSNATVATSSAVKSAYDLASGKLDANAKAVDSSKLDGLDSSKFIRSDVADTIDTNLSLTLAPTSGAHATNKSYVDAEVSAAKGAANAKLPLTGGTMSGNISFTEDAQGLMWDRNTDGAHIKFHNTSDGDTNSRLEFHVKDNGNEFFEWTGRAGSTITQLMKLTPGDAVNGLTFRGNKVYHAGNDGSGSGMDADKLDGIDSTGFLQVGDRSTSVASTSNTTVATSSAVKSAYDLANSKLNANAKAVDSDKLDGLNSTQFLRSDTSDTMSGNLTVTGNMQVNGALSATGNILTKRYIQIFAVERDAIIKDRVNYVGDITLPFNCTVIELRAQTDSGTSLVEFINNGQNMTQINATASGNSTTVIQNAVAPKYTPLSFNTTASSGSGLTIIITVQEEA